MSMLLRSWVPQTSESLVQKIAKDTSSSSSLDIMERIETLAIKNRDIHERDCFNLNPATNVMNPRAEALLASGIGTRPSLGYPGDKYEMGLEAIEEIEVITAELACEIFEAKFSEIRVPSGAIANLYTYMATCQPGDTIIAPPDIIGGHVTHHMSGCAGLFGLKIVPAPIDAEGYTVDVDALASLAKAVRPKLITLGASLNLFEHPVQTVRQIADDVGAKLMFDAAHQCGIIAGKAWTNPLEAGAHVMNMSTYKSLGGPPSGLIVTNDPELAQRLDDIAFPGMTANFDAAKSAALAISLLDWRDYGQDYAAQMIDVAKALAEQLSNLDVPVFSTERGVTQSHQFAVRAAAFGGGQAASRALRKAGFLACGIGLPIDNVEGDLNGLRIGTPELVRWGVGLNDVPELARLIALALHSDQPENLAAEVSDYRQTFSQLHYIHD